MHFVKEILEVEPFKLKLKFEDGSVHEIFFKNKLKKWSQSGDNIFKELLDPQKFIQVKFNKELETIQWSNGVDFCPDMLYEWSDK